MYEHDYDECANEEQFTEETLQDGLRQLITDGYDSSEICWSICWPSVPRSSLGMSRAAVRVV